MLKKKKNNHGVGYGLHKDIFYGNEKAIQWTKRILDGSMGMWKKIF